LLIALTAPLPFRRKWDQQFESAFLQRRVTSELGQLTVPAVEE
jgi:hypothetical protein